MLNLNLKKAVNSRVLKNVGILTVGNLVAQILSLVAAFYIPRVLGPEEYGIFSTVSSYVGLFTVLTFSGLNKYIIRDISKDLSSGQQIYDSTNGLRTLASIFATLVCLFVVVFVSYDAGTKLYIYIFSISLLFNGLQSTVNSVFYSHQNMKIVAYVSVVRQLIRVPLSVLILMKGGGVLSLIIINLSVQLIALVYTKIKTTEYLQLNFMLRPRFEKKVLMSGLKFSMLEVLNILSGRIDIVMLSFLSSPYEVGVYAMAYRIVEKFLILRSPISTGLFPYYSDGINNNKLEMRSIVKHVIILFTAGVIVVVPAIFLSKIVIILIVGESYLESIEIFNILVLYLILNFAIMPLGVSLQANYNEGTSLFIVAVVAVFNIGLNFILFRIYGIVGVAYSTLIVEFIRFFLAGYFVKKRFSR